MESQVVKRRVNIIAAHLSSHEDISATATHVFPMSCSNSLNSAKRRYDTRMYFARQISSSQASFMRQVSSEQASYTQCSMPLASTGSAKDHSYVYEKPRFSRPVRPECGILGGDIQSIAKRCTSTQPQAEPPKFARPNRRGRDAPISPSERTNSSKSNGLGWSPRIDVAESEQSFVVTIELPGVNIDDMRVEISDYALTVTGKPSTLLSKTASFSDDSVSAYHKREIIQDPCQIVWPLPANVDKDSTSAEFVNGLLQITLPKAFEYRRRMKAHM